MCSVCCDSTALTLQQSVLVGQLLCTVVFSNVQGTWCATVLHARVHWRASSTRSGDAVLLGGRQVTCTSMSPNTLTSCTASLLVAKVILYSADFTGGITCQQTGSPSAPRCSRQGNHMRASTKQCILVLTKRHHIMLQCQSTTQVGGARYSHMLWGCVWLLAHTAHIPHHTGTCQPQIITGWTVECPGEWADALPGRRGTTAAAQQAVSSTSGRLLLCKCPQPAGTTTMG